MISVSDDSPEKHPNNPYRTGGWVVLKEDAFLELPINQQLKDDISKKRFTFVPDEAWGYLGLPRKEIRNEESNV